MSIPFYDQQGVKIRTCFRTKLTGDNRFFWGPGRGNPLYGQRLWPEDRSGHALWIVESISDAWTLQLIGECAAACHGANAVGSVLPEHVAGWDRVYVLPQTDRPGAGFASRLLEHLRKHGVATGLWEATLPEGFKDVRDLLNAKGEAGLRADLLACSLGAKQLMPCPPPPGPGEGRHAAGNGECGGGTTSRAAAGGKDGPRVKAADWLLDMISATGVDLWLDQHGVPFARFRAEAGHRECQPIASLAFKSWARLLFQKETGVIPSPQAVASAVDQLSARAERLFRQREMFTRVGGHGGKLYLDLCDEKWRVIEVDAEGWRLYSPPGAGSAEPGPLFCRRHGALPLPYPTEACQIERLWDYINVTDPGSRLLLLASMMYNYQPLPVYPLQLLTGPPEAGKTVAQRVQCLLIDPRDCQTSELADDSWGIWVSAKSGWILALDNQGVISSKQTDTLCQVAQGGGLSRRKMYTDDDTSRIALSRPIIITSVEDVSTRPDLLSRGIPAPLSPIPECDRRGTQAIWDCFEVDRPKLLAAILDALSGVLRVLPEVEVPRPGRLGDYCRWGVALDRFLGGTGQAFLRAFDDSRHELARIACDASVLTGPLTRFLRGCPGHQWSGQASDLLAALNRQFPSASERPPRWPALPHFLTGRLKSEGASLAEAGIGVTFNPRWSRTQPALALRLLSQPAG